MTTVDSLTKDFDGAFFDDTFSVPAQDSIEIPPSEEFLVTERNGDSINQTLRYHPNDGSITLDADLGQLLLFPPEPRPVEEYFKALQKWEGVVIEVGQDTFLAKIVPIGEGVEQEAEIYIEEVGQEDYVLIEPGAAFYWTIGYLDRPSGRLRASIIRFRRLPVWTKRDLEVADAKANELRELFDVQ